MAVYKHAFGDHPWAATIMTLIADSRKALAGEKIGSAEEMSREALNLRKRLLDVDWNIAWSHQFYSAMRYGFKTISNQFLKNLTGF